MSDVLNLLQLEKFKNHIQIDSEHCLEYFRRQCVSAEEIIFTVHISYECLRQWHKVRSTLSGIGHVEILNALLQERNAVKVKEDCERIEGRLRRACSEIKSKYAGKNGNSYRKLTEKELKIAMRASEILTLSEVESQLKKEKAKNEEVLSQHEALKARCKDLYCQLVEAQTAEEEAIVMLAEANADIEQLRTENAQLHSYIEKLGQELNFANNHGKVSEVGERQQRRKLKELKMNIEKALWFAKTFGLELESVNFSDESGSIIV